MTNLGIPGEADKEAATPAAGTPDASEDVVSGQYPGITRRHFLALVGAALAGAVVLPAEGCGSDEPETCEQQNKVTIKANLTAPAKITGLSGSDVMLKIGYSDNNTITVPCRDMGQIKAFNIHFFGSGSLEFLDTNGSPRYFDISHPNGSPSYTNVLVADGPGVYEVRI